MAKILQEGATLTFSVVGNGDIRCVMEACVASDDLEEARSHDIEMSATEKQKIKNFAKNTALPQFKQAEGIQ